MIKLKVIIASAIVIAASHKVNAQTWISSPPNITFNGTNVGIGTTSPVSQLHLASDANHALTISRANGTFGFRIIRDALYGNVAFQIGTGPNTWETKIRIGEGEGTNTKLSLNPEGGNVGIGTTTPSEKLEIMGKLSVSAGGTDRGSVYFQNADVAETGYPAVWPDQNERSLMIRSGGYLDGYGAGGGGIQFFTYDVTGGEWGSYTGGYRRAMVIRKNGNIGIGTVEPKYGLHIASGSGGTGFGSVSIFTEKGIGFKAAGGFNPGATIIGKRGADNSCDLAFITANDGGGEAERMTIQANTGNVGIGTTDTKGYKLAVNGNAIFVKVKVQPYDNWSDYVFYPSYRLRPLSEVEQYIQQHHHLPDVPSAAEVKKNGIDVGDNQAVLLNKIEELTLYIIDKIKRLKSWRDGLIV